MKPPSQQVATDVTARARCETCGRTWGSVNAAQVALRHAAGWQHRVVAEVRTTHHPLGPPRVPVTHRRREKLPADDPRRQA